jgi:integrase
MPRKPQGQLIIRARKRDTSYGVRVPYGGRRHYVTLGYASQGMTEQRARVEVENVLADVRRGIWRPPQPEPVVAVPVEEPSFHAFASEWFAAREAEGLKPRTLVDLRGSLVNHLLPFFKDHRLSEITPREVKRYSQAKLAERNAILQARADAERKGERFTERGLSNGSINHTLRHLAQILEAAVDEELLATNAAAGKRRRLKAERPKRPWVELEQLMALLDVAKTGDGRAGVGRVLLGILAGAGLRIDEALSLRWTNVDLGTGTLHVVDSKTEKGVRDVDLSHELRSELKLWKADARYVEPSDFVVPTSTGRKQSASNLRRRVLAKAVDAANVKLEEVGIAPLGAITFHSLRRTYASLRCVCGDDIRYTADQLGHEDPRFTLRCYAQASKRRDRLAPAHRKAFDRALDWSRIGEYQAPAGTSPDLVVPESVEAAAS